MRRTEEGQERQRKGGWYKGREGGRERGEEGARTRERGEEKLYMKVGTQVYTYIYSTCMYERMAPHLISLEDLLLEPREVVDPQLVLAAVDPNENIESL